MVSEAIGPTLAADLLADCGGFKVLHEIVHE